MPGTLLLEDWQKSVEDRLNQHITSLTSGAQQTVQSLQQGAQQAQQQAQQSADDVLQRLYQHVDNVQQQAAPILQQAQQTVAPAVQNLGQTRDQVLQSLNQHIDTLTAPASTPLQQPTVTTLGGPQQGDVLGGPPSADTLGGPPVQPGGDLRAYARQAAQRAGIDPDIFVAQIQQESGFTPTAKSPAGAIGIAQFMPGTAAGMHVDPTDPYAALDAAAQLDAQNLKKYGGDYQKTLAAYNAGGGAVDQYGGVPPYKETQTYVETILNNAKQVVGGAVQRAGAAIPGPIGQGVQQAGKDISQFGDPQLTNAEAYSACGPAAAVRFAEKFGRNPTLREATDLAKQVGWTQQTGMAGIGSQQNLMTKLGIPTKLVQGAQWEQFAKEAQSGNPVTISTGSHYFFADGYDPQSGAFHVGRSGTDLRGGKEWMTSGEIVAAATRLGGGEVQGALFADNPGVPTKSQAKSVAAPEPIYAGVNQPADQTPQGFLRDVPQTLGAAAEGVGGALAAIARQPAGQPAQSQPIPSDVLTNPLGTGNTLEQPSARLTGQPAAGIAAPTGPAILPSLGEVKDALLNGDTQGALDALNRAGVAASTSAPGRAIAENQANPPLLGVREAIANAPVLGGALGMARGPLLLGDDEVLRSREAQTARTFLEQAHQAELAKGLASPQVTNQEVVDAARTLMVSQAIAMTGEGFGRPGRGEVPGRGLGPEEPARPAAAPPPAPPAAPPPAVDVTSQMQRNFLRDTVRAPNSDPRLKVQDIGLPNEKLVHQNDLTDLLPPGTRVLYHETSVPNARAILDRIESGPRNQNPIFTSDNPDLALGQGGKGVVLEFDPARSNGGVASQKPGLAFTAATGGGQEYTVSRTLPGAVSAIVVRTERQAAQLATNARVARAFDFANAEPTAEGRIRIPRRETVTASTVAPPQASAQPPGPKGTFIEEVRGGTRPMETSAATEALSAVDNAATGQPFEAPLFRQQRGAPVPGTGTFWAPSPDTAAGYGPGTGDIMTQLPSLNVERVRFTNPLVVDNTTGGHRAVVRELIRQAGYDSPAARMLDNALQVASRNESMSSEVGYPLLDRLIARTARELGYDGVVIRAPTKREFGKAVNRGEVIDLRQSAAPGGVQAPEFRAPETAPVERPLAAPADITGGFRAPEGGSASAPPVAAPEAFAGARAAPGEAVTTTTPTARVTVREGGPPLPSREPPTATAGSGPVPPEQPSARPVGEAPLPPRDTGAPREIPQRPMPEGARPIELSPQEEIARLRLEDFPEDLRPTIQHAAEGADFAREQRRGVIPDAVSEQMAKRYADDTTLSQLIRSSPAGTAFNEEQIRAVRNATGAQAAAVNDAADAIARGDDSSAAIARFAVEAEKLDRLVQVAEGARAEAGRSMRAFRDSPQLQNLAPNEAVAQLSKMVGGDRQKLMDAIGQYQTLVNSGAGPVQMANFWAGVKNPPPGAGDWFKLIRYNSMLSGPRTFEVNAISNSLELPWRFARDAMASTARGRPGEVAVEASGAWAGLDQANRAFLDTLFQGITQEAAARGELPMGMANRVHNPVARGIARGLEMATRPLAAADEWSRAIAYNMSVGRLAAVKASEEGLRGQAWTDRVSDILSHKQTAPQLMQQADGMANRMTFHGDMGNLGQGLQAFTQRTGILGNLILPFLRTTYQITSRGIERSPLGLVGTGIDVARGAYGPLTRTNLREALAGRGEMPKGVTPLGERLGDNVIGSAIFLGLYSQAADGNISGAGPDDPGRRRLLQSEGWQPYSVRVGNRWVSYANWGPAAIPFAMAAAATETQRYARAGMQPGEMVLDGMRRTAQIAQEQTYLQAIGSAWKGITDPAAYGSQFVNNTITSLLPFGSAINTLAAAFDPNARKVDRFNALDAIQSRLPSGTPLIGGREDVPVAQDVLGRPAPNVSYGSGAVNPFRVSEINHDPVLAELDIVGVAPPGPPSTLSRRGVQLRLSPDEQRQVQSAAGELIDQRIAEEMALSSYQQLEPKAKARVLQAIIDRARTQAENSWLSGLSDEDYQQRKVLSEQRKELVPVGGR